MYKDSLKDEGKKTEKQYEHAQKNLLQSEERGDTVPSKVASCPK